MMSDIASYTKFLRHSISIPFRKKPRRGSNITVGLAARTSVRHAVALEADESVAGPYVHQSFLQSRVFKAGSQY